MKKIIYQVTETIIEHPTFGYKKHTVTIGSVSTALKIEDINLAKEWGSDPKRDGYSNKYEIETADLKILNLKDDNCTFKP